MMITVVRNVSLAVLAFSTTVPALYAYEPAAAPATERIYAMTNDAKKNEVLAFARGSDGSFYSIGRYETGGRGSGGTTDPLASQGALTLSQDRAFLFAVNAGSGTVSSFIVSRNGLILVDKAPTDGAEPVSVTQHGQFVYVLNQGSYGGVTVFRLDRSGHLTPVPDSTVLLSGNDVGGASVAVSPDGQFLAVVERLSNNIDIFHILSDGNLSAITTTADKNAGGFAAIFTHAGQLLVSETGPANVTDGSTISSFSINSSAAITPISSAVPTDGAGNCWLALTPDGKVVYTSNSASSSISGFNVANNGALTPIGGVIAATNPSGSINLELGISSDGKLLYSLNSGTGTISVFSIQSNGTLQEEGSISGLPKNAGDEGLAAF